MSLDLEIEFEGSFDISGAVEEEVHETVANLAHELERGVRKRDTLWPQDTGFSRDRFRLEDDSATNDILVLNTARYAEYVNDRPRYPRGGSNPNYRAAQRAIEKLWARALRKVVG